MLPFGGYEGSNQRTHPLVSPSPEQRLVLLVITNEMLPFASELFFVMSIGFKGNLSLLEIWFCVFSQWTRIEAQHMLECGDIL